MSWEATTYVTKFSGHKGAAYLTLLILANRADPDGSNAYPSVETLARETRMSARQTRRILRVLEASGEVCAEGKSKYGTTNYRIVGVQAHMLALLPGGGQDVRPGQPDRGGHQRATPGHPKMLPPDITVSAERPYEPPVEIPSTARARARTDEAGPVGISAAREVKLATKTAEQLWISERRRHRHARYTDSRALSGLRMTVKRALGSGLAWADIERGIRAHVAEEWSNPWKADVWAREAQAIRAEQEAAERRRVEMIEDRQSRNDAAENQWRVLEEQYPGKSRREIVAMHVQPIDGMRSIAAAARVIERAVG